MGAAAYPSVFLLVRSLEVGGAERQLCQLALGLKERHAEVKVGVFYRRGPLAAELEQANIEIVDLGKNGRWDLVGFFVRLRDALERCRPEVVYSFLGGANIAGALVRSISSNFKLVWSVRGSNMDLSCYDWTHRLGYRIETLLAHAPDMIIANSKAGAGFAVRNGFPEERTEVVLNGIDTRHFRADRALRQAQRRQWGLGSGEIAIGVLARLDPMKDHETFLRAAALLCAHRPEFRFLCVGEGPLRSRLELLAAELGIQERVLFTGHADPLAALNALDCVCSSSITEGFPNSIAEAMACGKPCAATDAGDSAFIIGETGSIVPPRDPAALASALCHEIECRNDRRSAALRRRVVQNFSLEAMVDRTLELLTSVATG